MTEFEDVKAFHIKFDQLVGDVPRHLTKRKLAERANFILEELLEFANNCGLRFEDGAFEPRPGDQNLAEQADALIDIVYVAMGTAVMLGLPWKELWDDVQRANMAKIKRATKRKMGYGADIGKPDDWAPPNTDDILYENGYLRGAYIGVFNEDAVLDACCYDDKEAPGEHR